MKLLIMGIQGSGKGTQSVLIAKEFNLKHLSTGDLIRAEIKRGSEDGKKIKDYSDKGLLAPNDLIEKILFLNVPADNFIIDGYPRNIEQAKKLDKINIPDKVIFLHLNDKQVLARLSNRFSCPKCKEAYGLNKMPKMAGICDKCGAKLEKRIDDNTESIKKRIEEFHKETKPLLKYYGKKVIEIDGDDEVEKVFEKIKAKLRV